MIVNTYPLTDGFVPPEESYYRIRTSDGIFFHLENWFLRATVYEQPIDEPNEYRNGTETADLLFPKIPAHLVYKMHRFFARIRRDFGAEAYLRIYANPEAGEYLLEAPPQINRSATVTADATVAPDGYFEVGSAHAHPASAFHSTTDVHDEQQGDGIHLIFGHVDRFVPEIVAVLSVRRRRFTINPADVLELPYEYDGPWMNAINRGTP